MINAQGHLILRTWPRRWAPKWSTYRVDPTGVPDRSFYDDKPLGQVQVSQGSGLVLDDPNSLGAVGVHWWGDPVIRWGELLATTRALDAFGIALRDLFQQPNIDAVKAMLDRDGKVHVVLADPRSAYGMARYDEDFGKPFGDRFEKIVAVLKSLRALQGEIKQKNNLRISLTRRDFKYSAYRIDEDVLYVPIRMTPGKKTANTPALVLDRTSSFIKRYLREDLDNLRDTATPLDDAVFDEIERMRRS